jgi:hypothetical protein
MGWLLRKEVVQVAVVHYLIFRRVKNVDHFHVIEGAAFFTFDDASFYDTDCTGMYHYDAIPSTYEYYNSTSTQEQLNSTIFQRKLQIQYCTTHLVHVKRALNIEI